MLLFRYIPQKEKKKKVMKDSSSLTLLENFHYFKDYQGGKEL